MIFLLATTSANPKIGKVNDEIKLELAGMVWLLVTPLFRRQYELNDGTFGAARYDLCHVTEAHGNPDPPFDGIDNVHMHYQVVPLTLQFDDLPSELGLAQPR